jgi:DNA primase RepB-like protein/primase-like protein
MSTTQISRKLDIYNRAETERFLKLLDPTTSEFTFQTFDDDQDRKAGHLAKILHGTLEQHYGQLYQLSEQGAGIFITVNKTDGKGRQLDNITDIRAVWREDDEGSLVELPIQPHIKVESSADKHHEYILVNGLSFQQHQQVQKRLAENFGSDKNATDITRVLRLPGFPHQKNNAGKGLDGTRTAVSVVSFSDDPTPYSAEQVLNAFDINTDNPIVGDQTATSLKLSDQDDLFDGLISDDQVKDLKSALSFLDWDDRDEWVKTGQNLKACGEKGFELWDAWSQHSAKYDPLDSKAKWLGFSGTKSNYKSIFSRAMMNGWINPKRVTETTKLQGSIYQNLSHRLGVAVSELAQHDLLDLYVLDKMIISTIWQPTKSKFLLIGESNNLLLASEKDVALFLKKNYGTPYNVEVMNQFIDVHIEDERKSRTSFSKDTQNKLRAGIHSIVITLVSEHVKLHNQRPKLELITDMFSDKTYIDLSRADKAVLRFKYTPSIYSLTGYDEHEMSAIYDDYNDHFPILEEIIDCIVAARFASDRKTAYLWFHCPSDWGKGFLLSILDELGLVVSMSDKELDSILSGSPVGKSPHDFVNSLALVFDEVKRVTGNHKLLQSYIPCTPKHEMTVYVPVYTKLFLSAEHIYSLAGEHGVETQFANRFNLLRLDGNLSQRELFRKVGSGLYHKVCKHYISRSIDEKINNYRAMGLRVSEKISQDYLIAFHDKYGIGNSYELLDNSLEKIANEILDLTVKISHDERLGYRREYPAPMVSIIEQNLVKTDDGKLLLKSATTVVRTYIESIIDVSSQKMMIFKIEAIIKLMGEVKSRRVNVGGKSDVVKGIDVTDTYAFVSYLIAS